MITPLPPPPKLPATRAPDVGPSSTPFSNRELKYRYNEYDIDTLRQHKCTIDTVDAITMLLNEQ